MENSKALAILNQNVGRSLVFARKEEIEAVSPQYEPIVTVIEFDQSEFTDVGMGNMYPGKAATNRIADAAGVSFLHNVGGTKTYGSWASIKLVKQEAGFYQAVGEYKVIGTAQGQRLKPDGAPRLSSPRDYEFNVVDRANEDFVSDFQKNKGKYKDELNALKHLLDLKKFSTQRAATGAELAVIRELVGMPTAFKADQIRKPMVFSQIVENNRFKVEIAREIMKTPDGRAAVVNALFGATQSLFGPQQAAQIADQPMSPAEDPVQEITPADDQQTSPADLADEALDDSDGFDEDPVQPTNNTERDVIEASLEEWVNSDQLNMKARDTVEKLLSKPETPLDTLRDYLNKIKAGGGRKAS